MSQPERHNHADDREAPGDPCLCQWCQQPVRRIDRSKAKATIPVLIEEQIVSGLDVGGLLPRAVWPYHVPRCESR